MYITFFFYVAQVDIKANRHLDVMVQLGSRIAWQMYLSLKLIYSITFLFVNYCNTL